MTEVEHAVPQDPHEHEDIEYRIERLRQRLANGETAELGLRIEARANAVAVSGTVANDECREEILRAVQEELAGVPVRFDVTIAPANVQPFAEEL